MEWTLDCDGNAGMTDRERETGAGAPPDFAEGFARDWITLWQSELAALSSDREVAESLARVGRFWAERARAWQGAAGHDPASGAGPAMPAGAAAAAAAPDILLAEFARLAGRVAELERRLDQLERN